MVFGYFEQIYFGYSPHFSVNSRYICGFDFGVIVTVRSNGRDLRGVAADECMSSNFHRLCDFVTVRDSARMMEVRDMGKSEYEIHRERNMERNDRVLASLFPCKAGNPRGLCRVDMCNAIPATSVPSSWTIDMCKIGAVAMI